MSWNDWNKIKFFENALVPTPPLTWLEIMHANNDAALQSGYEQYLECSKIIRC